MNKTIYEKEFTKMVHDKMREANRFKEYERIPKNRIGGDYWNTYWTIRYMLRTIEDILANGDKLVLLGYFTVKPKFYKERTACPGMERTGKNVYEIPERYKAKFKSGTVLNRACEAYGDYLKEEANNKDDEYEVKIIVRVRTNVMMMLKCVRNGKMIRSYSSRDIWNCIMKYQANQWL